MIYFDILLLVRDVFFYLILEARRNQKVNYKLIKNNVKRFKSFIIHSRCTYWNLILLFPRFSLIWWTEYFIFFEISLAAELYAGYLQKLFHVVLKIKPTDIWIDRLYVRRYFHSLIHAAQFQWNFIKYRVETVYYNMFLIKISAVFPKWF